jgi:hypothetical protein
MDVKQRVAGAINGFAHALARQSTAGNRYSEHTVEFGQV